jgi:hypothetical protein
MHQYGRLMHIRQAGRADARTPEPELQRRSSQHDQAHSQSQAPTSASLKVRTCAIRACTRARAERFG